MVCRGRCWLGVCVCVGVCRGIENGFIESGLFSAGSVKEKSESPELISFNILFIRSASSVRRTS